MAKIKLYTKKTFTPYNPDGTIDYDSTSTGNENLLKVWDEFEPEEILATVRDLDPDPHLRMDHLTKWWEMLHDPNVDPIHKIFTELLVAQMVSEKGYRDHKYDVTFYIDLVKEDR